MKLKAHDDKERRRAQARARYAKDPSKKKASVYAWRLANPEKAAEAQRISIAKNREKYNATRKAKRDADPEAARAKERQWAASRREKRAENSRAWRLANPDKRKEQDWLKKAKRRRARGKHTAAEIKELAERQDYLCVNCRTSIADGNYHRDHIVPLSLGGTNWIINIQLLCPPCNMRKHNTHPDIFAERERLAA